MEIEIYILEKKKNQMWVAQSLTGALAKLDKSKNLVLKNLNWNAKVTNRPKH